MYLLTAPYLSFEGLDLIFCGYDVDVGLSVAIEFGSDPPRKVLVGVGEYGTTPCSWSGERIVEPIGHGHDGFSVVVLVSGFSKKVSHVRLLVRGIFFR